MGVCLASRARSVSKWGGLVEAFLLAKPECNTPSLPCLFSSSLLSLLVCFPPLPPFLPPSLSPPRHSCCWITERMWRAPCRMGRRTTRRPHFSWPPLQVIAHKQQGCGSLTLRFPMCIFDPSILVLHAACEGLVMACLVLELTRRHSHSVKHHLIKLSLSITIWESWMRWILKAASHYCAAVRLCSHTWERTCGRYFYWA